MHCFQCIGETCHCTTVEIKHQKGLKESTHLEMIGLLKQSLVNKDTVMKQRYWLLIDVKQRQSLISMNQIQKQLPDMSLTWKQWNQWLTWSLKKVWQWWNAFLWRRKKAAKWDVIQKWWVTRCGMVCNPLHERRWSRSVESHSDVISVIPYGMSHKNKTTTSSQLCDWQPP